MPVSSSGITGSAFPEWRFPSYRNRRFPWPDRRCKTVRNTQGLNVDVGVVEYNYKDENKKTIRKNLEVDFIINRGSNRYYIQSALNVDTKEKQVQETESLRRTGDSFKKVVIVRNNIVPRFDDDGILYIGVEDFLLDERMLDL